MEQKGQMGMANCPNVHYNGVMKILLTTLHSKFIHSSLALRSIQAYAEKTYPGIQIVEFAVNEPMERILGELALQAPDLLGFSCYLWNIEETLRIAGSIKKILPAAGILLGGPEVSYDGTEVLKHNPFVDYCIAGEGELPFVQLLESLQGGRGMETVSGLLWRKGSDIMDNGILEAPLPLDDIPFAYGSGFRGLKHKILYYETSRGCPYRCQYCLSSARPGVRYLSVDRAAAELRAFAEAGIPQVKLVDRTFNCDPKRARELFQALIALEGQTNFHMEMAGDLLEEELLAVLKEAPPGRLQFEIGIQTVHSDALQAIERQTDLGRLKAQVQKLIALGNIHVHLDLIAGLPWEGYDGFAVSFNEALALQPHRLQLGFLKLLKGSGLRSAAAKYGYVYAAYPPYEVLGNDSISFEELYRLKGIEALLELYYNNRRFGQSLACLIGLWAGNAFQFFEALLTYWRAQGHHLLSHKPISLYRILLEFGCTCPDVDPEALKERLVFDFLCWENPDKLPGFLRPEVREEEPYTTKVFLSFPEHVSMYLPHLLSIPHKQRMRLIHVHTFHYPIPGFGHEKKDGIDHPRVLLFDYSRRNPPLNQARIVDLGSY